MVDLKFVVSILVCLPQVGGIPAVLKYLLDKGFIDGDCITGLLSLTNSILSLTKSNSFMIVIASLMFMCVWVFVLSGCAVTGKTLAENLAGCPPLSEGQASEPFALFTTESLL